MKIINNNNIIELNGHIRKNQSKFFAYIEVPLEINLDDLISNIQGYYDDIGNVTLVNNKLISVKGTGSNPNVSIYEYESNYCISGHIENEKLTIKYASLYYKEMDYFFVKNDYKINLKKMNKQFSITQKYYSEILYEDDKIKIFYSKTAGLSHDKYGYKIFKTPVKLEIIFKNLIHINYLFEEIRKLENCIGFIINRKMSLIEATLGDSTGVYHDFFPVFVKKYEDIILTEFHIVDLNSKGLLKDVLKKYYMDEHIASSINMFFEYIYNDLDTIFEFTSLVNTLELILSSDKYYKKVISYTKRNNKELKMNNNKMNNILKKLTKNQAKFIKSFYNFDNVNLRDRFSYVFYNEFKLAHTDKSDKYISSIISTRNYYVHGTKCKNKLGAVDMVCTKFLLKDILYLLIVKACSNKTNILTDVNQESIPVVYNNLIKDDKEC